MTVSVTLTFPNVDATLLALAKLAQVPEVHLEVPVRERAAKIAAEAAISESTKDDPAPVEQTTKRRGRPPKTETTPPATPAPAPAPEAKPITREEALAKFKELHDAKGIVACKTLLDRLGAKRFADVHVSLYPDLIALCSKAMAGEDLTSALE